MHEKYSIRIKVKIEPLRIFFYLLVFVDHVCNIIKLNLLNIFNCCKDTGISRSLAILMKIFEC